MQTKFSAIFILCLFTLNIVSTLRLSPIEAALLPGNSLRTQLAQMLIQVKQENSPTTIKMFIETIRKMLVNLRIEQEQHQAISDKMMKQCKEEDEFRGKEVTDAKDALNRGYEAREKCDASLKASQKDLPELQKAKDMYEAELKKATDQRNEEHKSYLQRKSDFEEAIVFLTGFMDFIKEKLKGSFKDFAFVEKSETLMRHASRLGLLKEAVPILVVLAQAANEDYLNPPEQTTYKYTANEAVATKLKNAVEDLLVQLENDRKKNEEQEKALEVAFEALKNKLTEFIDSLTKGIDKTQKQIDDMTKCVTVEDEIIAKAQAKFERNEKLQQSALRMCDSFAKEFTEATKNRMEEVTTIDEILKIIEVRFGPISNDLKEYLESVQKGWKEYINSTEFKKFEEYQQQHIVNNEEGAFLNSERGRI